MSHGSALVTWTSVGQTKFKLLQGEESIGTYESSPGIVWKFCKACGTSLFYTWPKKPEKIYMTVANLEAMDRKPDCHVNYNEHADWMLFKDVLPKIQGITGKRCVIDDNGYGFIRYAIYLKNVSDEKSDPALIKAHVAHIETLEKQGRLEFAGPFMDEKGGGMLVIKAKNLAEVEDFVKSDPFVRENKKTYQIRPMEISCVDNGHLGVANEDVEL